MDKSNQKKPWYKRVWVWVIVVFVLIGIGGASTTQQGTNTQQPADTTSQPAAQDAKSEEKPAEKWDMESVYAKIENGMTKAQVKEVIGKEPESCTESQDEYIGKTELCTYGNAFIDKATIIVTFSQDVVSGKTKSTY